MKTLALTTTAALMLAGAASAQLFGDTYGTDLDYDRFNAGFGETGYYNALDRDRDTMLNESEYATGVYSDLDRDNDVLISEDEFTQGNTRYFGDSYGGGAFTDYDADASGFIDQTEFRNYYDSGYNDDFVSFDGDGDGMLTSDEYSTGLYGRGDRDQNQVISIEEEGLFEGWFDGDDVEAEIETVGEVY